MFWADKILENRTGKEIINDSWTPSGIIHMGGLKGPVIHDTLYKILKNKKADVHFMFGFDDFDPIDGLPADLQKTHQEYMGVPISNAPAPDGSGTFGEYYGNKMRALFNELEIEGEIYLGSDYYKKGIYNESIKFVLDNAENIKKVYEQTYSKTIPSGWYPLQVVCPNCGKLGTTKVIHWDGSQVKYVCSPDLVKWAKGCGAEGSISPLNGNAKMPFKVEWAVKWHVFGVTIEGAGKDHASAGGTYDIARKILRDVFKKEPPLKLPYEFFLWNGKKMSSSKGLGLTGEELLEVLSPSVARFLMIKTEPNRAVEFNPKETEIIPKLYDEYQKSGVAFHKPEESENARAFELSQIKKSEKLPSLRFSVIAQLVQMPNMQDKISEENLKDWARYAKIWIEKYAPESEKFIIQKELPPAALKLSDLQKKFLSEASLLLDKNWTGEELQKELYELSKNINLSPKDAFSAVYAVLIGKDHGPRAAWLILSLEKEFIKNRFNLINGNRS